MKKLLPALALIGALGAPDALAGSPNSKGPNQATVTISKEVRNAVIQCGQALSKGGRTFRLGNSIAYVSNDKGKVVIKQTYGADTPSTSTANIFRDSLAVKATTGNGQDPEMFVAGVIEGVIEACATALNKRENSPAQPPKRTDKTVVAARVRGG